MTRFKQVYDRYHWDEVQASIRRKTQWDVEAALEKAGRALGGSGLTAGAGRISLTLEDFKALISPAAAPYLEQMAQISHRLTQKRFGKTIQLFAPMYLSNECNNICTYCGFSLDNKIRRKTLSPEEILQEVEVLRQHGFRHILLVTGESAHTVNAEYMIRAIELMKPHFAHISIEVQPLLEAEYERLHRAGVYSVLVYQETYHREKYSAYHPKGKKSNFYYRLETPDRIGLAGMHKIGLGVLLGLEDWRTDSFFCALHLEYLQRTYWRTKYSLSFPRIRPAEGVEVAGGAATGATDAHSGVDGAAAHIDDRELVQLICAYRLLSEDLEISISTRESALFRDHIIPIGTTTMSAGSKTNPGGYSVDETSLEQFEISDERSPAEIAAQIVQTGYQPVWKDWDNIGN